MRHVVTLLVAVICITSRGSASQAPAGGAATGKPVGACSILTKDLVAPFAQNKKVLDLIPPEEESMAGSASACEYGIVRLQLYPTPLARQNRASPGKDFQPLSGAGEAAYFRNNRNNYAELLVWTATHHFTLQVSVPTGSTAEAIKPNTVALANAIIAKLR
jgi:hypothetical protein